MAKGDLIPLTERTPAEAYAIRSKGGKTKSPQKKYAALLREWKKKIEDPKRANEAAKRMDLIMTHPEAFIFDIATYLEEIKQEAKNPTQKILIARCLTDLHKAHHGEKVKMESRNVNLNIDVSEETANKILNGVFNN